MPTQDRAQASVDAIVMAAEQLLAEQGFDRMTTNRVAARAGVNVALVYRYFSGKEAIVGALIERAAGRTYEAVQRALADHASASLPIALRALFDALTNTQGISPALHRELVEHVDMTKRREQVRHLRERLGALFAAFLAQRAGDLRPLPDREATMFVVQHMIEAATHAAAFYRPSTLSAERVLNALTELTTHALAADERGDSKVRPPSTRG